MGGQETHRTQSQMSSFESHRLRAPTREQVNMRAMRVSVQDATGGRQDRLVTHTLIRTWGPGACSLTGEGGCECAGGAAWRLEATDRDSQRENSVVENKCTPNPGQTRAWNSTADPQGPCPRSQHLQFLGEDKMFNDDHTHHLNGETPGIVSVGCAF